MRAGFANRQAQTVSGYFGGGFVQQGTIADRPDDKVGLAIAHAIIGASAAKALGLSSAETNIELTYQAKISRHFVIQPDVNYIRRPAGRHPRRRQHWVWDSVCLRHRLPYPDDCQRSCASHSPSR